MIRQPDRVRAWRRRTLLTGAASMALSAGLGACGTDTAAIGAPAEADDEQSVRQSPDLLAYRTARNFGEATAPAGSTYSIFHGFARGAVPAGHVARIAAHGGVVDRQQCNNRVFWPDGSLRCAVFVWSHPETIAAGASGRITIHSAPGAWNDSPGASPQDLLAHDYRLQVEIGGVAFILSANNEIRAGARVSRIRSGPACTAWKIWGDFRAGTSPGAPAQGQMWGKMYLYLTADSRVRIENEIYCNKIANSAAIPVTSYALLDGERVLFKNATPFTLYTRNKIATYDSDGGAWSSGGDLSKVVWAFPRPSLRNPASTGLYDAAITWWNEWTPAYIAAFPPPANVGYAPNSGLGALFPGGLDGTGDHDWLGPMASYSIQAMLSGRYEYERQDRQKALGGWGVAAYWCADPKTGLPPVLNTRTYASLSRPIPDVGWGLAPTLSMAGGQNPGTTADGSHAPLFWCWQYLGTGSEQALENMMEQAVGVIGCDAAGTADYQRNPVANGRKHHAVVTTGSSARAMGWIIRNLSNTHWVCPDSHPMKPYLNDLVQAQYDAAADRIHQHSAEWAALGVFDTADFNRPDYHPVDAPWMHDYFATSITMDVRRHRIEPSHPLVAGHLIKWIYGRMVDGNFFNGAGAYRLDPGKGPNAPSTAPYAQSWTEVYGFGDPPTGDSYPLVDNPPVRHGLRDHRYRGPYINPPKAAPATESFVGHTYPNIALCAGACGVIAALGAYPQAVVAYLQPLIDDRANAAEAAWGRTHGAQAWRIRVAAQAVRRG